MSMTHQHFRLEISFNDKTDQPVAAYLQVRSGAVAKTREIEEGIAFADYDEAGVLLGVELLSACSIGVIEHLVAEEPELIQRFVRGVFPHSFVQSSLRA